MNRLIINTSNEELFLILKKDEQYFSMVSESNQRHNETMLTLIDEFLTANNLKISDIDEFGVVVGPGSFTGIRVGIATVKAFRDSLKKSAKGINNLQLLFDFAKKSNSDTKFVAISAGRDSYFVARMVNDVLYIYDRVITLSELNEMAGNNGIGMYKVDEKINSFKVEIDAKIANQCFENSLDSSLVPEYYQLSQAENEKLKKGEIKFEIANIEQADVITALEKENISYNTLNRQQIEFALNDKNNQIIVAKFNNQIVGFVLMEITDEVNISSIVVNKDFRNLGIASNLITNVEKFAKSKNINNISLEVSKNNPRAYLLYEKLGFKTRRIRKNYYNDGADCYEMVKTIS